MTSSYPHQSLACQAITASLMLRPSCQSDTRGTHHSEGGWSLQAGEGLCLIARVNLGVLRNKGESKPGTGK